MNDFRVEISQLDTVNGVFRLQTGHLGKVQTYVQANCNAGNGFTGLAVAPLQGHYDRAYTIADTGTGQGRSISENCTTTMNGTKAEYLRQDRAAYDRMAAKMRAAGETPPPYRAPGDGPAPRPGASVANAPSGDNSWWRYTKQGLSETTNALSYADKVRSLGPFGPGLEAPKPPEYPDSLNPAKWREYAMNKRLYDSVTNRWDTRAAADHNARNTGGDDSWTEDDARRAREDGWTRDRQRAREDFWERVDWAEADRRNGADTTGDSSFTADDMRQERESQYRNPAPTDSRGTTWDANQTFGAAQRAVGLPGALIGTGEGLVNTWQHGQEAADLRGDVNDSIDGPSNDDSARWANRNGGQW